MNWLLSNRIGTRVLAERGFYTWTDFNYVDFPRVGDRKGCSETLFWVTIYLTD